VRLEDFLSLVERLKREIPREFEGGIVEIDVNPKAVPHPVHADVYTMGECIPVEWSESGANLQSRIVLYHGSFQALARNRPDFDWRQESWDTLTHELRHHLELRARVEALERYDWAAEQNFARHAGRQFDPAFYRSGEQVSPGVYKVDDDVFIETDGEEELLWHGKRYRAPVTGVNPPAFLTLRGLVDIPHGDAVLVLPKRATLSDLWQRPAVTQQVLQVRPTNA
jgi:hypothetical protein